MSTASGEPMLLCSHSLVDPPSPGSDPRRGDIHPINPASFREILACVDRSDLCSGVAAHAKVVARALGARLTFLHVLESEPAAEGFPPDSLDWGIRQREAQVHLDGLAARAVELESGIRAELIQGRPAERICRWAEEHRVDLTVLCSHGARGVTEWDLASTARKLIDRVPGSLLLVPAAAAIEGGEVRYRKILVPLDGSPRAESVVPISVRIAASENAEILFAHFVPVPEITRCGPLDREGAELERQVIGHNQRVASAYLDRLRARTSQVGSHVRSIVIGDGSAKAGLERLIQEEAVDLVVMSAHGHTGRTDSPCGSFTEYALNHATVPLLVVRERAHRPMRRVRSSTRSSGRLASSGKATL